MSQKKGGKRTYVPGVQNRILVVHGPLNRLDGAIQDLLGMLYEKSDRIDAEEEPGGGGKGEGQDVPADPERDERMLITGRRNQEATDLGNVAVGGKRRAAGQPEV